jgi:hypothetical protein
MGEMYEWGNNPIKDFLFQLLMYNNDISSDELMSGIVDNILYMLKAMGIEENCIAHLDFEIKQKKKGYFKVVPYNMLTAMWFSGFFIKNCGLVLENNSITLDGIQYKFNKKTKKLTWQEKK